MRVLANVLNNINANEKVILYKNNEMIFNAEAENLQRGYVSLAGGSFYRNFENLLNSEVIEVFVQQWNHWSPKIHHIYL